MSPRVSGLRATWTLTTSDSRATAAGLSNRSTPRTMAFSSDRLRLHATTRMPKARARVMTSCPIWPVPISPSVRP
jgi:hypothetical protein